MCDMTSDVKKRRLMSKSLDPVITESQQSESPSCGSACDEAVLLAGVGQLAESLGLNLPDTVTYLLGKPSIAGLLGANEANLVAIWL